MDLAGVLVLAASVTTKVETFRAEASYPSDSSIWIQSQVESLGRGVNQLQDWLHNVDLTTKQSILSSLQHVFETIDSSIEQLHADIANERQSDTATNGETASHPTSGAYAIVLERHSVLLKDCVALADFALAVCHVPDSDLFNQEIQELAVGARILRETLTSTRRESQRLWHEQKSDSEQYISANYDAFIDTVLAADDDPSDGSASEATIRRASSTASSVGTDFSAIVARGSRLYTPPDDLHFPDSQHGRTIPTQSASLFNGTRTNGQDAQNIPVPLIIPYRNGPGTSTSRAQHENAPARPPKLSVSASYPRLQPTQSLKRKPVTRRSIAGDVSTASLSSSSSSSAAEKAINIASEMRAQSPTAGGGAAEQRDYRMSMRSLSDQRFSINRFSINTLRPSSTFDKYHDSPPPYASATPQAFIPQLSAAASAEPTPTPVPKRRETMASLNNSRTPFIIKLVRENQIGTLRNLPKEGIDLDEVDPTTGRTALMEAALLRQHSISQILTYNGSRLHLKDLQGNTALHFAAAHGDAANCQTLLDAGAQVDEWNRRGETPLQVAALGGHTDAVVCLLQNFRKAKPNDPALLKGFFEASKSGNVSTAQAFLDNGLKPKKIKESWKPIAYAAQSGSIPMLDFMLDQKLNIKDRSPDGWTALHYAARHGHPSMVERLLDSKLSWKAQTKKTAETALHLAIAAGHVPTAQTLLLHKDASVNLVDADGQEPIHHAVRNGDLALTSALLNQGGRLSTQNRYGWKPIHIATAYGHIALVADFMTRGISLDEKLGSPAFKPSKHTNEAARKGLWAEIRWPHPGARPLHLALEFGHDEIADVLLQGGAKLEEGDAEGWQPLHYAAFHCRLEMLNRLLGKGASSHATTVDGNTPLSLGFRGPGLAAREEDKRAVCDILQTAMNSHKKSKFKQLTAFISTGSGKSRTATERNKVWHTAELAAALFQEGLVEDGELESGLLTTFSQGSSLQLELEEEHWEGESEGQAGFDQAPKSPP